MNAVLSSRSSIMRRAFLTWLLLVCSVAWAKDPAATDNAPAEKSAIPKGSADHLLVVDLVSATGEVSGQTLAAVIDDRIAVAPLTPLRRADRLLAARVGGTSLLVEGVVLWDRELDLVLLQLAAQEGQQIAPFSVTQSPDPGEHFQLVELDGTRQLDAQTAAVIEQPDEPIPPDVLLCDAAPHTPWQGAAWITTSGHLAGFASGAPFTVAGQSLAAPGRVLKNVLRRNRERVPLSLDDLRSRLNTLTPVVTQIFPSKKLAPAKVERGQQLDPLRTNLRLLGPKPGDSMHLGEYRTEAAWQLVDRRLVAPAGKPASLQIATADQFGLEFDVDASGKGGWFLVLGYTGGHGYVLCNIATRKSGSPWLIGELVDGKVNPDTYREITRYNWTGNQKLGLTVTRATSGEYRLDGKIAGQTLLDGVPLPRYQPGDIYLATYTTQYGPMPLRITSIRGKSIAPARSNPAAAGKPAPTADEPPSESDKAKSPPR